MKSLNSKTVFFFFFFLVSKSKINYMYNVEHNKTFSMIPHSNNKKYSWSYDEKYDIFLIIFFVLAALITNISNW